ncbi:hypothetical protein CJ030_MR6G027704 [Morella rubra]|uniref:Uncharacterized protein n=1 Tax=Morella rubra TaxID=262757 RepID=A0A6A1V988_9ROSI|nr:hypothetical protein CJ030_MR6G027704 [Morella rubra]
MELYAEKVNKEGFARLPRLSLSVTSSLVFLLFGESEVIAIEKLRAPRSKSVKFKDD